MDSYIITSCTHEILRNENDDLLTDSHGNLLLRDKNSGDIIPAPITSELTEIFGFSVQEELTRQLLYDPGSTSNSCNIKWSNEATLMLIECFKNHYGEMHSTTTRKDIFHKKFSITLCENNFNYSPTQVKDRLTYLKKRYHKWIDSKKRSGCATFKFEYGPALDDIFGKKPNCIPVDVADTSSVSTEESNPPTPDNSVLEEMETNGHPQKKRKMSDVERRHQERMALAREIKESFESAMEKLMEKLS